MKSPANVDFIRESIITFLSDSLDKIAAFIAFVYFANYFTTDAFGTAYTVIGISMMAGSAPKAIADAISKRISEDTRTYDPYFTLGVASIIAFVLFAAAVVTVVIKLVESRFEVLALAGLVHLGTRPFLFHVERVYDGVGMTGAAASLDFVDGVLTALLRFVLILGLGFGPSGLLYSGALSAAMVGTVAYYLQFGMPTALPTRDTVADIKTFAGWSLVGRVSIEAFHNWPTVLAGVFVSPTLASWIRSAQTLSMPGDLPGRSVVKSIFVQVSGDLERGAVDVTPIQTGIDIASIFGIPLIAGAVILGDSLMPLVFGAGYENAGYVLVAVAAARVFDQQARILISTLNGADHPDATAKTNVSHAIGAGIVFMIVMILGGRLAFLLVLIAAYASWMATAYWFVDQRVVDVDRLSWRFVLEQALAAMVMTVAVAGVSVYIRTSSWLTMAFLIGIGGVVYAAVLLTASRRGRRIAKTVYGRFRPTQTRA